MRILLANFSKMVGDSGGLAKVNVAFANEMVRRGHTVTTIYSDDHAGDFFYPLDERVTAYNLHHFRGQTTLFPTHYKIRREILRAFSQKCGRAVNNEFTEKYLLPHIQTILTETQPEIIIAFQPASAKAFLYDLGIQTPVIVMAHGDTRDYFYNYPDDEVASLRHAAVCQALLPAFAEPIREYVAGFPVRVEVIGNVVPQYAQQADLAREKETYKVVFVGRLVRNINSHICSFRHLYALRRSFPTGRSNSGGRRIRGSIRKNCSVWWTRLGLLHASASAGQRRMYRVFWRGRIFTSCQAHVRGLEWHWPRHLVWGFLPSDFAAVSQYVRFSATEKVASLQRTGQNLLQRKWRCSCATAICACEWGGRRVHPCASMHRR